MKILDTLSEQKIELESFASKKKGLKMFVCGPTVYDYPHIGNARTYVAFDLFARWMRFSGWKIFYLQNITDIDDKIIRRANEEKTDWQNISKKFEKIYHQNEKSLGIVSVTKYARATEYIKQIVGQVKKLIEKGFAYKIENDGYYFDISKFKDYGKLSKRTLEQAEDAVSRIDDNANKKNKGDFALWKFSKDNEPFWKTELGNGRPGWHIEDTAITEYFFGPQYDLHGGAVDLKFPHHEAEIAQQESASGKKPLVKTWMHTGFLLVNGQKMSKSLENFVTIENFLKNHSSNTFRFIVLSHHYHSPVDYTEEVAKQAEKTLSSIQQFIFKLSAVKNKNKTIDIDVLIKDSEKRFVESMNDDFNTPKALSFIFELINKIEKQVWEISSKNAGLIEKFIRNKFEIFGIRFEKSTRIPLKIRWLLKKREALKNNQQFIQSDALRKDIKELGYIVEDTKQGQIVYKSI
jgi:cysteinyl-tRNA synthetase